MSVGITLFIISIYLINIQTQKIITVSKLSRSRFRAPTFKWTLSGHLLSRL